MFIILVYCSVILFVFYVDLLDFSTMETDEPEITASKLDLYEWWMMDQNPNLPEPALKPELFHISPEPEFDLDLISFTEFDDDEIRTGGVGDTTLPPPLTPTSYLSFDDMKARNKSSSDDFVDNLFSSDLTANQANSQHEPDLMRMLVGRCSPVDSLFAHTNPNAPLVSSDSTTSETYSVLNAASTNPTGAVPPLSDVSYSQLLGDMFTTSQQQQAFSSTPHRAIRPKIAANFNKQI